MFLKNLYKPTAVFSRRLWVGITVFLTFMAIFCHAQSYSWHNPDQAVFPVISGRYWQNELTRTFDRLPSRAAALVRPEVWRLSQNSAGEYISFHTDAANIRIKYSVENGYQPANSTALLVSGVDLYLRDSNDKWYWTNGKIDFGDTIIVNFENVAYNA